MPAAKKKTKGGKQDSKKTEKKGLKGLQTISDLLKNLRLQYDVKCKDEKSFPLPTVKNSIKEYEEKSEFLVKFVLFPGQCEDCPVKISPLLSALRSTRYVYIKELYIWDIPMKHEDVATLALFLEKGIYRVQYLELMSCSIESYAVQRLGRSFVLNCVTTLLLDYNQFGDEGCEGLCRGLKNNKTLLRLSLNYCNLGPDSGRILGDLLTETAVCEIYLDGNHLECEGVIEMIKLLADKAEMEAIERAEKKEQENVPPVNNVVAEVSQMSATSAAGNGNKTPEITESPSKEDKSAITKAKKKGKKKKKKSAKKKVKLPPRVGPWIEKIHIANNGIDAHGPGSNLSPVMCMRLLRKLITHSDCLKEIDLEHNLIGDLGGRELLEALMDRKEAKLTSIKLRTTHRMNSTTFANLVKHGGGMKKKAKKRGKPGKKRI
ncbi:uncharacterized protein LOC114525069 isoform X2 [Dendronephthya gigantea]|uniref:uncharacterized protein LOC114525069 isoform X2 n=1 Tax=Dendronephthya gigantea TaxID=151771 RepID=UPI00106ACB79|nr:uncharacterized protein LOC114525069 isoform X2 [Dendronephthya gigantea]